MKNLYLLLLILFIVQTSRLSAQDQDYQIGLNPSLRQTQGAYYDYSDPNSINIKVAVWGYVRNPGRYVVPSKTDVKDLISYAGGINDDAYLDELRIYRINKDSSQSLIKFNYEDLWWNEDLKQDLDMSKIQAGDVLIVPGRNRLYWENYLQLTLSVVGFLISVATFIITATK